MDGILYLHGNTHTHRAPTPVDRIAMRVQMTVLFRDENKRKKPDVIPLAFIALLVRIIIEAQKYLINNSKIKGKYYVYEFSECTFGTKLIS